jgi:hypothetical protein
MTSQEMIDAKLTNTQAISAMILTGLNEDKTQITKEDLKSAFDAILGVGAYDNLVSSLYYGLREK